jgi:uncharacterized membrane protein
MDERDYRERLARDASIWRREGLISPEQERDILGRAGAGQANLGRAFRMRWMVTAVSIFGALILGAGIIQFFAANWDEMPDWSRVAVVFITMASAYGAAYALMFRLDQQRIGSALLLLGAILYESGIFLIAQIYNMPVDSPVLLLLGGAGILPLAYAFGSRIILLLALGNLISWAIWRVGERYEGSLESMAAVLIGGVLGVALYATGRLHTMRRSLAPFGDVYGLVGLLVTMSLVYVFTFDEPWREMIDEGVESYAAPAGVFVSIAITAAIVVAYVALRPQEMLARIDAAACLALLGLAIVVATWPAWTGYALVFNAVYFALAAGLVARGFFAGDEGYMNLGLLAVAIGVLTRFVDVFWSLMAGSAFFIVGGMLLLATAFALESLRRSLLASMPDGDGDNAGPSITRGPEPGATTS